MTISFTTISFATLSFERMDSICSARKFCDDFGNHMGNRKTSTSVTVDAVYNNVFPSKFFN